MSIATTEEHDGRAARGDSRSDCGSVESRSALPCAILDALPTHVALVDARGVIVTVNESWRRFGAANGFAAAGGGIGQNYLKVCDATEGDGADDARRVAAGIRAILSGSVREFALEYPCHSPDAARWYRVLVTPLVEADREGAVVMHLDVTPQRQAEDRLRARETLLSNAQRIAHMGSWELDVQANRLTWSPEAFDLFGVRPDAFASTYEAFYARLLPEDREAMDIAQARADDDGVLEVEYRIRRPDGQIRWMYERGQVLFDAQGRQVKRLGVVMDVTERHALDDALDRNQALLRTASQISRLGAWRVDLGAMTVTWSDEVRSIHEVDADFVPTPDNTHEFYAPEHQDAIAEAFAAAIRSGAPFDVELQIVTARTGRRVWVRVIGEAVRDDHGAVAHLQGAIQDLTERKQAELHLRESQERLRQLADAMPIIVWTASPDGEIDYTSHALAAYTGAPPVAGTPSESWRWAVHPDDRPRVRERWTTAVADGTAFDLDLRLRAASGAYRWHKVGAIAVRDEEGAVRRWYGTATDVHDTKRLEQEARVLADQLQLTLDHLESAYEGSRVGEERFRLLAKATKDAIWDLDIGTGSVWWSEGFHEGFGYGPADGEWTLLRWLDRIHPDDLEGVRVSVEASMASSDENWSCSYRFRRGDGRYAYVLVRGYVIRDERGVPVRMIGGMMDLTERREVEERLAAQAALIDAANEAIVVHDPDGRIELWNKGAERTYGWSADEVVGRTVADVFGEIGDPACGQGPLPDGGVRRGERSRRTRDGRTVLVEVRTTVIHGGDGAPRAVLSIEADITDLRKMEQALLRTQRLDSIGTLAGGIAHDLNNALAPILMAVAFLKEAEGDPERLEELTAIEASANRGAGMVRQLLMFARGFDGERVNVQPSRILADVQKIVRDTFPKNIEIEPSAAPDLWSLEADPTQVHQVLMNLCINARDAMPDGGKLLIGARNGVIDDVYSGMNPDARPGAYVVIRVEDTGVGMSRDVQDKMFEPFFTTKGIGRGTGLGLSTTHAIVKGHGGFINVYSEVGRGTRIKVYLPAQTTSAEADRVAVEQTPYPQGQGETVLVVDDEDLIRRVVSRTLERFGYRVLVAANGAEGVALFALHRAEVAVVLTDMAMPVMDGPTMVVALRSIDPDVRIVASSGLQANGYLSKAAGAGVHHFVPKPYSAETLLTTLRAAILRA